MPKPQGYRVVADMTNISPERHDIIRRLIEYRISRHGGLKRRTGNLSGSAYAVLYSAQDGRIILVAGADIEYAVYLTLGTSRNIRPHKWIMRAVLASLNKRDILSKGAY